MSSKPALHIGFEFQPGKRVLRRVAEAYFSEVYSLEPQGFLYLLRGLDVAQLVSVDRANGLLFVQIADKQIPALVYPDHSDEMHAARIRDLTTLHGFQCVAGMEDLKALLRRDVIEPLRNPEKFRRQKLSLPNGILLFGPPGCGKTFLVRKLAEELRYRYFEVKHSDLASPFIHETVAKIGRVFDEAERAPPSVVFFDEMSGLAPRRDQLMGQGSHKEEEVNEFLMRLDGASQKKILVVGATNFPERIDPAVVRSGRMDKRILIPPPDEAARKGVLRIHLSGRPVDADLDHDRLSESTSGFVCSDIELLANNSARIALDRECSISMDILLEAASKISPSVDDEMLERFERLRSMERW